MPPDTPPSPTPPSPSEYNDVSDLIRAVEAALPPEKRSVGSFLALAEISRQQLLEATKDVAWESATGLITLYDLIFNSTLDQLADTLAYAFVSEQVLFAITDANKTVKRLDDTIATLKAMDPTSKPPLTVYELFYSVPSAGAPYVPLYTAPYRFMNQAQEAISVYKEMKGTFAYYMVAEVSNRAVELASAAVKALTPKIPLALIAALLFGAGYYLATRKK